MNITKWHTVIRGIALAISVTTLAVGVSLGFAGYSDAATILIFVGVLITTLLCLADYRTR